MSTTPAMATKAQILAEVRQPPKVPLPPAPPLVRSYTSPYAQIPASASTEALTKPTSGVEGPQPVIRKRHSMYIDPPPRSPSPIPDLPPHRPPRNPARASAFFTPRAPKTKSNSRPSTATGSVKEVAPQVEPGRARTGSLAPSVKSKASSTGMGMTGTVEEVTPWELMPVPLRLPSPKRSPTNGIVAQKPIAPPPESLHPSKATGLVEDVAPWELEPVSNPVAEGRPPTSPSSLVPPLRSQAPSLLSIPSQGSTNRLSTATGPTSEVAPWELEESIPLKKEIGSTLRQRNSLTLSKAELEEVMPWELEKRPPVPPMTISSFLKNGTQSSRVSTSSSKNTSDTHLLRRRRSISNRAPPKIRSGTLPEPIKQRTSSLQHQAQDEVTPPTTAKSINSSAAVSSADIRDDFTGPALDPKGKESKQRPQNPKFSTADRTILEELKRNIHARNTQFVLKGVGTHLTDGTVSRGKKHHPYTQRDVPYPRNYEREVLDLDIWETLFCQEISESLTFNVFKEPPTRVLDLGCGTGTWIVNCARQWKDTQFVGLDIVPLHPDLHQVGSNDLASRITWTQANFLEGLPFPNDEFDFVHIKRISLGVPEDKWDALFDEISRVMKPGGALEIVEEDLFFPGKPVHPPEDDTADAPSLLSRSSSIASLNGRRGREVPPSIPEGEAGEEQQPLDLFLGGDPNLTTPTPTSKFPEMPPVAGFSNGELDHGSTEPGPSGRSTGPPDSPQATTHVLPHSRSAARPKLSIKPSGSGHARTSIPPKHSASSLAESTVSLLNSLAPSHHTTNTNSEKQDGFYRRRRSSSNLTTGRDSTHSNQASPPATATPIPAPASPKAPFLLRTPARAVPSPRDHSLLEYIYYEMLSSRFINPSPLALLSTYLEYHFKDARTHPPLLFSFPPLYARSLAVQSEDHEDDPTFSPDSAVSAKSAASHENGVLSEDKRYLSMQGLLHHASPFITLDVSKTNPFAPYAKSPLALHRGLDGRAQKIPGIPNKNLNIDLRTLHLHLALRANEIMACAETMWDWVRDTQLAAKANPRRPTLTGSGQEHHMAVLDLNREDFNQLLLNFEKDMQDQASINVSLKETFDWKTIETEPSSNRLIFDKKLRVYAEYTEKEREREKSPSSPRFGQVPLVHPARTSRSNSVAQGSAPPKASNGLLQLVPQPVDDRSGSYLQDVSPTQRLSRSVCVFVAWKPEDK